MISLKAVVTEAVYYVSVNSKRKKRKKKETRKKEREERDEIVKKQREMQINKDNAKVTITCLRCLCLFNLTM